MAAHHIPSVDEIFDVYSQLDVDASGRVSRRELERFLAGNDLHHSFLVKFDTADIGIFWTDGTRPGSIVIRKIEKGSPGDENPDVIVGLELATVNGYPPPSGGGAKKLTRLWNHLFDSETAIEVEFYEPFCITHEFARDLDVEIERPVYHLSLVEQQHHHHQQQQQQQQQQGSMLRGLLPLSIRSTGVVGNQLSALSQNLQRLTHRTAAMEDTDDDEAVERITVTARVPMAAYPKSSDLAAAIAVALGDVAPTHFHEGCCDADEVTGVITIRAAAPFRLLGATGPSVASMHRLVGFPNEPLTDEVETVARSASKRVMSLQFGFKDSHQIRVFTGELMPKYDVNGNGHLEFDEFRELYLSCLHYASDRARVRETIVARFRTDEELELIALDKVEAKRKALQKADLVARRGGKKLVAAGQKERRMEAANQYMDCDAVARLVKPSAKTALARLAVASKARGKELRAAAAAAALQENQGGEPPTSLPEEEEFLFLSEGALRRRARSEKTRRFRARHDRFRSLESAQAVFARSVKARDEATRRRRLLARTSLEDRGFAQAAAATQRSQDDRTAVKLSHAAPHPAFVGHAFKKKGREEEDASHPAFYGLRRVDAPHRPSNVADPAAFLRAVDDALDADETRQWRHIPMPPLSKSAARAANRALTADYDRSAICHPAFWGSLIAPVTPLPPPRGGGGGQEEDHRRKQRKGGEKNADRDGGIPVAFDARFVSPACAGYTLERQAVPHDATSAGPKAKFEKPIKLIPRGGGVLDPIAGQASGFDPDVDCCHICLGGGFGCPWCFEMPPGFKAEDFAYSPQDVGEVKNLSRLGEKDPPPPPKLHTDLTTRSAVLHDRRRRDWLAEVRVKSVPCGAVVALTVQKNMTVGHIHHLFKSNTAKGNEDLEFMVIPTEKGLVEFEAVEDQLARRIDVSTTPEPADVPLSKYGFDAGSRVAIFHGLDQRHLWSMIARYTSTHLSLDHLDARANRVIRFLDDVPPHLPGRDTLQLALWDLFTHQERQHDRYFHEDAKAEVEALRQQHLSEMGETLAQGLARRRAERGQDKRLHSQANRKQANRARLHKVLQRINKAEKHPLGGDERRKTGSASLQNGGSLMSSTTGSMSGSSGLF